MSRPSGNRRTAVRRLRGAQAARRPALAARVSALLDGLRLQPGRGLVAVSGGVDSTALLHLLASVAAKHRLEPIVAHLDHGIHPLSHQVANTVERLARSLGLPFVGGRLALGPNASETSARNARLRWLEETRRRLGARYIFFGHQADDQAETVLMRMLRGSGPSGLAGMPVRRGRLIRPLLRVSRQTILRYARANALEWWDDPANLDPRHLRSWIRNQLLPQLTNRLPDVASRLRRTGQHAALDRRAWRAALQSWPGLEYRCEGEIASVNWGVLSRLPASLGASLVQAVTLRAGITAGLKRIRAALRILQSSQSGASADLGRGWSLERSFDRLRLVPPVTDTRVEDVAIAGAKGTLEWGGFQVRWSAERAPGVQTRDGHTAWFIPAGLVLRPWRAGDRLSPLGGRGHRLAVRCFQDARVPSRDRRQWPMLEVDGELAWIPGVCRSDRRVPDPGAPALRVDVIRRG